MSKRSFRCRFM